MADLSILDQFRDKFEFDFDITILRKSISGTYKNTNPASDGTILELRVDVDGTRPQDMLSGDVFKRQQFFFTNHFISASELDLVHRADLLHWPFYYTKYDYSFVVQNITEDEEAGAAIITGPVIYYNNPTLQTDSIEVRIKRVPIFSNAADATVYFYRSGNLLRSYCLKKISDCFRQVTLEIDRFQGTSFPPTIQPNIEPSPDNLPTEVSTRSVFRNAGICITVQEDDVLNDSDSDDAGNNWSEAELHDLMEDRFDLYSNTLQWNTYGVVVPRFGDPGYSSGYYGTMFDWGGWQVGDTYFRQGCAIAEDAINGRSEGTLYNSAAKKERLLLQTFIHEIGHSFNLPHSWSRSANPSSASNSPMNYPWGYTGGGGESGFWSDFRWQFDDVELIWMRHQDRNDVIFGGTDWIGNNLTADINPQSESVNSPFELELSAQNVQSFAEPVRVNISLTNVSPIEQMVINRLDPEDQLVSIFIKKPNGDYVRYVPPVRRLKAPGDYVVLAPGESISDNILISFSSKGPEFQSPGEYYIRAFYGHEDEFALQSKALRLRVATPKSRKDEELAYTLFEPNVAKFLYFNGSERYPKVIEQLEETAKQYGDSHPEIVQHIRYALGVHWSREFKKIETKKGKRVVTRREPKRKEAISFLQSAMELQKKSIASSGNNIRFAEIANRLSEVQMEDGKKTESLKTIEMADKILKEKNSKSRAIMEMNERLKQLKKTQRKK